MKPWTPAEVLSVTDKATGQVLAIFVRITMTHWAKPGALIMWSLVEIEADLKGHQCLERFRLERPTV